MQIQRQRAPTSLNGTAATASKVGSSAVLGLGPTRASRRSGFWHCSECFWREVAAVRALSVFWRDEKRLAII